MVPRPVFFVRNASIENGTPCRSVAKKCGMRLQTLPCELRLCGLGQAEQQCVSLSLRLRTPEIYPPQPCFLRRNLAYAARRRRRAPDAARPVDQPRHYVLRRQDGRCQDASAAGLVCPFCLMLLCDTNGLKAHLQTAHDGLLPAFSEEDCAPAALVQFAEVAAEAGLPRESVCALFLLLLLIVTWDFPARAVLLLVETLPAVEGGSGRGGASAAATSLRPARCSVLFARTEVRRRATVRSSFSLAAHPESRKLLQHLRLHRRVKFRFFVRPVCLLS